MAKIETYTTGQISGVSMLSFMSLYRYVRTFPEFFSPSAGQHVRGRRWNDADLELLLSIEELRSRKAGTESIREALATGWRFGQIPPDDPTVRNAFSMVWEVAATYQQEARKETQANHELVIELEKLRRKMSDDHDQVLSLTRAVENQAKELNRLWTRKTALISFGQK